MKFMFTSGLFSVLIIFYRCLFSTRSQSVIRRVSFICLFGLIVSIASLCIIFSVMGGLGEAIRGRFLASEPHIIITFKKSSSVPINEQKGKIQKLFHSARLESGVTSFDFFETIDLVIRTSESIFSGAVARGYDTQYLKSFLENAPAIGRMSSTEDIIDTFTPQNRLHEKKSDQVIQNPHYKMQVKEVPIGNESMFVIQQPAEKKGLKKIVMSLGLANELNLYEGESVSLIPAENLLLPPGEPFSFEQAQLESVVSVQNESWNSNSIFYDSSVFPAFSEGSSYSSGFEIRLQDPNSYNVYQKLLLDHGYLVEVWTERNSSVLFALKIEKMIMSVFLSLAGLITLLAISSLLVLLIVQKKREIGALMTMGLPLEKIRQIFVGVGLLLCAVGVIGGIFLGLLVCLLLKYSTLSFLTPFYYQGSFPIEFNLLFLFLLFFCTLFFAFLSCYFAVRSHLSYSPAELLKTIIG